MSDITTLLATFFGAWFAYKLRDNAKTRDERKSNIGAANRALFTVFQQINSLKIRQIDMIDPVRNHPGRFIAMQPVLREEHDNLRFDFSSLGFLLETQYKQIVLDLFIEEQRFHEAVKTINYRSALHMQQVQPILEHAGIQEGVDCTKEELAIVLGPRLYTTLQRATDQVVFHVDRTIATLSEVKGKMIKAFKELYPEGDFLNFELLEDPHNKPSTI